MSDYKFKVNHLSVQGKVVKPHGADEVDVGGLGVHDLLLPGDPQARVLRQHLHYLNDSYQVQCVLFGKQFNGKQMRSMITFKICNHL